MAAAVVTKQADLAEVPVLVRAGAILVEAAAPAQAGGLTGRAARPYDSLSLTVFLGGAEEGGPALTDDDFGWITEQITEVADETCAATQRRSTAGL